VIDGIITCDIDSTLADTGHRHHMIDRVNGTDWDAYSKACVSDAPVISLIALVRILVAAGCEVHALSGRKVSAMPHTVAWFQQEDVPIETFWLDETDGGAYASTLDHARYKLQRIKDVERLTGKKVLLHIDDWATVAVVLTEAGYPTVCVRTPQEIKELVGEEIIDGLR
jgi:hypothetical protein